METLFIHDTIIINKDGVRYTKGDFNDELVCKYRKKFKNFTMFVREKKYTPDMEKYIKKENEILNAKFNTIESLNFIKLYEKLRNIIKNYDFLIIRLPSFTGIIAKYVADKYQIPYLIEMVGCSWDSLWNHDIRGKIIAPIMTFLTKKTVKNAKYVIYVTKLFLQKRYPTKGKYISSSDVELNEDNENILENRLNKINVKNKEKIIVGTIGNVDVKYKGHRLVLYAISNLKKKGYNIEYQLVGGGEGYTIKKIAEKLDISDNVKIIGPKPHNQIFQWMDELDIYIQPSYAEGLCRSIIEAMSRACPCIVSDVGGNVELVNKKYVFKKGNKKDLENKIFLLIESKKNLKESINQNYYKSLEFNKKRLEEERMIFYDEILKDIEEKN